MKEVAGFSITSIRALMLSLVLSTISAPVLAAVLSGAGIVPLPAINLGTPTLINPLITDNSPNGFSGAWSNPAATPWSGTFTGTGTLPSTPNIGTGVYDFSGLINNSGLLPVNTFFNISDLDFGSATTEKIILTAFSSSGNILNTPWLQEPDWIWGTTAVTQNSLPAYIWNSTNGTYTFDGAGETFIGNPNLVFTMLNNQEISQLEVTKLTAYAGFSISAPAAVPLPAAFWLLSSGLITLLGFCRFRQVPT